MICLLSRALIDARHLTIKGNTDPVTSSWKLPAPAWGIMVWGVALAAAWFLLPGKATSPLKQSEFLMDSTTTITAYGPDSVTSNGVSRAFGVLHAVDALASFHRPDSELSRLNRERRLLPTASMAALLRAASEAAFLSQGNFDATFAGLHQAYGFYSGKGRLPPPGEISECLAHVGWSRQVTETSGEITLATGTLIDLSGIAGGWAVEAAAEALRQAFCMTFFIDDGGDLWMEGSKPDDTPWRVAVKDPRRENGILATIETSQPTAISTSGDYERFVIVEGRKIGHIFDPHSGVPAEYYHSVTIIASTPVAAEILSKTLFCLPPEKAREYADQRRIPALFLPASGTTWMTEAGQSWFHNVVP